MRQERICKLIERHGQCSVDELARQLEVSGMTVRRDLAALASQGRIIRTHGGATLAERFTFEFAFRNRVETRREIKEGIGRTAAARITDGQAIILDSGTTTLALARQLHGRAKLTVITTSLPIAAELQYDGGIEVLLLGGYLRSTAPDLAGALTEANLEGLRADAAFLGADAVGLDGSVYNQSPEVGRLLEKMAHAASSVTVVADSSKLGKTALWRFGRLPDWTALVTDRGADRKTLAALRKAGAAVILCDS
jgi:DeoR/GlpR family transcriptional regulator of sugar metabolism